MDKTKWMYVLIEDDDLLEENNTIWDKVSAGIKKEFDGIPISHGGEVEDFCDQKNFLGRL